MKRIKRILLAAFLFFGSFALFSCEHAHSVMDEYHYDETNHWQECFGCDEKINMEAHKFGEWVLNTSKTEETRECVCGYVETRDYENPHTECTFTNYVNNNDATCTKNATETAKCDGCNKTDTREVPDSKLPHSFTSYESDGNATCTSNGTETAKCDNCTKTDTREVADSKLPHSFTNYVANNDATCLENETETAKCDHCDAIDTREIENSKVNHDLGDLVAKVEASCTSTGMQAHYKCVDCETYLTEEKVEVEYEELIIPITHEYGEWVVTKNPTFTEVGTKTRTCECDDVEEEEIPALVAVTEVVVENEDVKLVEGGSSIILSGLVNPVDAENYEIEWTSSNAAVEIVLDEGVYKAVTKDVSEEVEITITFKVTNVLEEVEYTSVTDSFVITVVEKSMIAEFTFEDGFTNTGSDSSIEGYMFSNANDNRGEKLVATDTDYIFSSHTQGDKTYEFGTNGVKAAHVASKPSFGTSGFDLGSGDFTISVKHYMPYDFIKSNFDSKNEQWCVLALNSEENDGNNLFIYLGKDTSSAGFFRPIVKFAGEKVNLYEYNVSGYYSGRTWTEYRIVKQGCNVIVSVVPASSETNAKCVAYSYTFTLESPEDFTLTEEQVFGLGCNYGALRPGNDSYYDDLRIWNYAHIMCLPSEHEFVTYVNNNDATCTSNATETAKCEHCDIYDTREVADSKLEHSFTNYVSDNNATCTSNCTETAKCDNCDATDTREIENSMLDHNYGDLLAATTSTCEVAGILAHYYCEGCGKYFTEEKVETTLEALTLPLAHVYGDLVAKVEANCTETGMHAHYHCSTCNGYFTEEKVEVEYEELIIPITHEYGEWVVTKKPTFTEVGTKTRTCECSEVEEDEIPMLIEATLATIENEDGRLAEGSSIILSGLVNPVDAENYEIEWTSSDALVEIVNEEGVYKAVAQSITDLTKEVTITFTVTNILEGEDYSSVSDTLVLTIFKLGMIAEFTFEDGFTNTGIDSSIEGYMFSNANDNRGEKLVASDTDYIFSSHTQGDTTYQFGTNGVKAAHVAARPSFGTSGIDLGSGDFAISVKHYMPYDFIKSNFDSKNEQWCVLAVNSEANDGNNLFIYLGKDTSGAGFFRPIVKFAGEKVNLYEYNVSGYYSGRKWTEYRIVKQGCNVIVSIVPSSSETNAKCVAYSYTFTLESPEDFTLTEEQLIGLGNNYGTTRPGNDSYYDELKIWNYAYDFGE